MASRGFIPYNKPSIGHEEITEVANTLRSGWLTTGDRTARFEREFAAYAGSRHALAVNSCTAGLHLALVALGVKAGDEVITSANTFCATVNTVIHCGAKPVLADVGGDGNIAPESIRRCITKRTKAIVPVHFAGNACDMGAIWEMARDRGIHVVEDAAHAAGTRYRGRPIGTSECSSDAIAFSFYATKNMTTGEGGMVTTGARALYEKMRVLALHGIDKDAWNRYKPGANWRYEVTAPGFKYNLSDIQSAIGIHQLRKLERFVQERSHYAELYSAAFAQMPELEVPPVTKDSRHSWHLYVLRLRKCSLNLDRDRLIDELHRRGVGTSVHFIPIHLHAFFAPWIKSTDRGCPNAVQQFQRSLSLPLYPGLSEANVARVIEAVKSILYGARRQTAVPAA